MLILVLVIIPPKASATSGDNLDPNIIDKIVDDMDTLSDVDKQKYKSELKKIFTLDDLNKLTRRAKGYGAIETAGKVGEEAAGWLDDTGALDKMKVAKPVMGVAQKIFKVNIVNTIVNDGIAWLDAHNAYYADPTNAEKDRVYSEKAFRFYSNFMPFGGLLLGMMMDSMESARERAEFEANQKKIFNMIIETYEQRVAIEMRRRAFARLHSDSATVNAIFGDDGQLPEPRWHLLRGCSEEKIERMAKYMQEHPKPGYNAYNAGAFLRMMKHGGIARDAFLRNMQGGGPAGFAKHSPVYMTITDPFGHEYGVEPDTKRLLCDDAAICSPMQKASDAQYIVIPSIYNGVYKIQIVGYDDGEYSFLFHGFNHNSELQGKRKQKGYIHKGEVLEANLTITLNDKGYDVSELNFVKIADSYLIPSDPETLLPAIDRDSFEIYFNEPCLSTYSYSTLESDPITTSMFEGVKQDYFICLEKYPRPTYTFFTNKFFDPQAINEHNFQFIDGKNNRIKGLYEISDSTFSFTSNVPLLGGATIILKRGKEGICSKTKVCLEQDLKFTVSGLEPSVEWEKDAPFEFIAANPVLITKKIQIINEEQVAKRNIDLTTLSFKSFSPNTFFFIYNISSPVPYEIIKGENDLIKFEISELKPKETLNIDLTYAAMLFAADYFSRLEVNKINTNYDPAFLKKFTRAGAGIEVEDPKIKELAQQIVGEEKNPFWKAYKIYNWITRNIIYDYEKAARVKKGEIVETGALLTLQTRKGICDDFTKLFLALARAAGIPSRYVTLYVFQEKVELHAFPEIYLPPYGWIPLDPTWGTNFDAFARTEPGLLILAKEDGLTENHHLNDILEGEDTEGIVVQSSIELGTLLLDAEEDWISLFKDRFFVDIYQLTFLSQINNQLSLLKAYNQGLEQQLFTLAEKPQTSVVVTAQQALEAYQKGNYPQIRPKVQKVIGEQFKAASTSFFLLAQKSQEYIESPYTHDSILLHGTNLQEGEISPTKTEVLQQINQTKKEMDLVEEQAQAGNYYTAANSMIESYFSTLEMYSYLIPDMVSSKIKTMIYSPKNIFRFNQGSVVFFGLTFFFMVLPFFFWLWMWINCLLKKEFRHLNKIIWFLIVFFAYILIPLGAIIYFFVEYRKRRKEIKKK